MNDLLEQYREPTIFHASLVIDYMYMFHVAKHGKIVTADFYWEQLDQVNEALHQTGEVSFSSMTTRWH